MGRGFTSGGQESGAGSVFSASVCKYMLVDPGICFRAHVECMNSGSMAGKVLYRIQ